ncbi:MAG: ATP-dependent Clp protease ATP-binding subunit [Candidatus Margulisiibacteriota bacterium]|nr:ATP-dependent Clp protease ATP-binding subunit [Candidatus Margulisiibacteriota bacterium]
MFERFTERAIRSIMSAQEEAQRLDCGFVGAEHLMLGMLHEKEPIVIKTIEGFGSSVEETKELLEKAINDEGSKTEGKELPFTPQIKRVIEYAWEEARTLGHSYVGVEHLFLGIIKDNSGITGEVMGDLGISAGDAKQKVIEIMGGETVQVARKSYQRGKTPVLDGFSRDLTRFSREKKLDPVIGRNKEIERVIQILSRRKKNNPVLLGEAGVGKTAIVEGLAQRIITGDVPHPLLSSRVVTLDMGLLIAGTRYRGEFEERLKKVLDEVNKSSQKIILFIDEIHTLIGAGAAEGAMDAANILKPALARGEIQCVGATTLDEYRKKIESDPALERRFQSVMVEEPSVADTIEILKGIRSRYEDFHKVKITEEALVQAVRLSERYISSRKLPDKAIDLIDEASSKVMLKSSVLPPELIDLSKEIEKIKDVKQQAVDGQEFERAAQLRDQEEELRDKYEKMSKQIKVKEENLPQVNDEIIAEVVAAWTGVPVTRLTSEEKERLLKMEDDIEKRLVGQNEAVKVIAKSIRRSRAGLKNPRRPIGSFIFLGPSGVGKTELAKRLAEFMFGDVDALLRIDMSEYLESHTVSRMVGSPPGYVGFGEGGQLTERVRRRPHSVVLFDEIEKAHQDVLNVLLQILDDGQITDAQGRKVDFKNTVIIMTSNVGAQYIQKETGMGFITHNDAKASYGRMKEKVLDELKKKFKPEFLNRIDEQVVFSALSKEDLLKIVDIMMVDLNKLLDEKGMKLSLTKAAKQFLVDKGYDPKMGARPLRRTIEDFIEDPLSEDVLRGKIKFGMEINGDMKGDQIVFKVKKTKSSQGTPAKDKADKQDVPAV